MVKIIIRGQSQSISKEEAKEAFSFFADELLGRRLSKNIRYFSHFRSQSV